MTVSLYRHCLQVSGASPASSKKKKKRLQKSEETEQDRCNIYIYICLHFR